MALEQELSALAADIAVEAGTLVRERTKEVRRDIGTKSSPTDMVTEVDKASEALIVERLLAARPGDAVLAEEGSARDGSTGVRWIVDPLDGTTNYLYGFPPYAVSIAAEVDGEVVAGVVFDAAHSELFMASRGGGATRNSLSIGVSATPTLGTALVGTGFGYTATRRSKQARLLAALIPAIRDIRRAGSAAVDLCSVACGRLDAYFEWGLQPWDMAAGRLIVEEAGGHTVVIGEYEDAPLLVAGNAHVFGPLCEAIRPAADRLLTDGLTTRFRGPRSRR